MILMLILSDLLNYSINYYSNNVFVNINIFFQYHLCDQDNYTIYFTI